MLVRHSVDALPFTRADPTPMRAVLAFKGTVDEFDIPLALIWAPDLGWRRRIDHGHLVVGEDEWGRGGNN